MRQLTGRPIKLRVDRDVDVARLGVNEGILVLIRETPRQDFHERKDVITDPHQVAREDSADLLRAIPYAKPAYSFSNLAYQSCKSSCGFGFIEDLDA